MKFTGLIRKLIVGAGLALAPAASFAGVFISVGFAPRHYRVCATGMPRRRVSVESGLLGLRAGGLLLVPGVWVRPPSVGLLWTPGYWGYSGGVYVFNAGYWGPHVGFYGGINYGFGFGGFGFSGGEWRGGHFAYNTAYSNVNTTVIHNTYVNNTTINNTTINNSHTSFNGGAGGVQARPTAQEEAYSHESHVPPTAEQQNHVQAAHANPANFAKANGGRPAMAAIQRPGANYTAVAARGAAATPSARTALQPNNAGRTNTPANARPNTTGARTAANASEGPVTVYGRPSAAAADRSSASSAKRLSDVGGQGSGQEARPGASSRPAQSRPPAAPKHEGHGSPGAESKPAGGHGHR